MTDSRLNPNISIDCVIFGYTEDDLSVLLVERQIKQPNGDTSGTTDLKLPGGLVYNDELLEAAAGRTLQELTTLKDIRLVQFGVLDSLDRMSNEADRIWLEQTTGLSIDRVVSVAFYGVVPLAEVAENIDFTHWVKLNNIHNLPFDHEKIIRQALEVLRQGLKRDGLVFDILPEKFTISQLQTLLSVFYDETSDSRNFRKKIRKLNFIVPLEEKQTNVAHKPARLYRFDKQLFKQFSNNRINF